MALSSIKQGCDYLLRFGVPPCHGFELDRHPDDPVCACLGSPWRRFFVKKGVAFSLISFYNTRYSPFVQSFLGTNPGSLNSIDRHPGSTRLRPTK
jgi:hypothetical protein